MHPDHAVALRDTLLATILEERETTRRILEAIPEERREYRPHADSRSALELAWHIVNSEIWLLEGILQGSFPGEQERMSCCVRSIADVLTWEEKNVPALVQELGSLDPARLVCPLENCGKPMRPAVILLAGLMVHTAHHRGQLSTYLRAMGARVPSIYGSSADEPFDVAYAVR